MSFYNLVFGKNPIDAVLLKMLDLTPDDFGRYRDTYVTEKHIVVYTRCGGGNRYDYDQVFEFASIHPHYHYDEDDDYDSTYASIFFKHPPEYAELLKELAAGVVTPSEKWKLLFEKLEGKKNES
jgi:hypothetical protein